MQAYAHEYTHIQTHRNTQTHMVVEHPCNKINDLIGADVKVNVYLGSAFLKA